MCASLGIEHILYYYAYPSFVDIEIIEMFLLEHTGQVLMLVL